MDDIIEIEVKDSIASSIDPKLLAIAKSARSAHNALDQLQNSLSAQPSNQMANSLNLLSISELKLATSQQKLRSEIERTNLLHTRSELLIYKEISALDKLSAKAASVKLDVPIDSLAANLNSQFGLSSSDPSKSARDSASVFAEQGRAASQAAKDLRTYTTQANELKDRLDPLSGAQREYSRQIDIADTLLRKNLITTNEHSQAQVVAKNQLIGSERQIKAFGNRSQLSSFQLQNLSYQLNDVVVSLYSGQKPMTVFMQQGSQIAQIFSGQGVIGALKGTAAYLGSFLSVGKLAFGGVAIAAASTGVILYNFYETQRNVQNVLAGTGAYAGITIKSFNDIVLSASNAGKVTKSFGTELALSLINTGNASSDNIQLAIKSVKNLSATLNITASEGSKLMSEMFANPASKIKELNSQMNFLDASSMRQINNLIAQGNKQEAITLAIEKMNAKTLNADKTASWFAKRWDAVKLGADTALTSIENLGNAVENKFSPTKVNRFANAFVSMSTGMASSEAQFIKTSNEAQELVSKFDTWNSSLGESRNALILVVKASEELRAKISRTSDTTEIAKLEDQLKRLGETSKVFDYMSESLTKFGNAESRLAATQDIAIKLINARTTGERASLSAQQALINSAGQNITATQAQSQAMHQANIIRAEAAKTRRDELYAMDRENALIGILGPQRQIEETLLQKELAARSSGNALSKAELELDRHKITIKQQGAAQDAARNVIYDETIGKMQSLGYQLTTTNEAYAKGTINAEAYAISTNKLALEAANLRMQYGNGNYIDVANASLGKLVDNYKGVLPGLTTSFGNFFTSVSDGFANSIGEAIVKAKDLKTAIHDVAQSAISGLISSLVKLGVQYLVNAALGNAVAAAATAASVAEAGVVAAAWAPAASAVSLASYGANAVPASAGITSTYALTTLLSTPKGFANGGLVTGPGTGTSDSILAKLSNGEFVVNAKATNDNRALLQSLNSGGNISNFTPKVSGSNASSGSKVNVTVINQTSANIEVEQISENEIRIIAKQEANKAVAQNASKHVANAINDPNSQVSRAINQNVNAARRR